jgi:hypothetical protein
MSTSSPQNLKALVADRASLLRHLQAADTAPLLMVLVHLGGDPAWLDRVGPHIKGPWSFHDETPETLKAGLREALADVLAEYAASGRALPTELPVDLLPQMLRACTGQEVPPEYFPMVGEEMDLAGIDPKTVHWRAAPDPKRLSSFRVLVVGAGFSGRMTMLAAPGMKTLTPASVSIPPTISIPTVLTTITTGIISSPRAMRSRTISRAIPIATICARIYALARKCLACAGMRRVCYGKLKYAARMAQLMQ